MINPSALPKDTRPSSQVSVASSAGMWRCSCCNKVIAFVEAFVGIHSAPEIRSRFQPFAKSLNFVEAGLDQDLCWADAVEGCDYVIHTAFPFPSGVVWDVAGLIRTAREGALRVLRAAHSGKVQKVALTSSIGPCGHRSSKLTAPRKANAFRS